jgi:hypothetical protein
LLLYNGRRRDLVVIAILHGYSNGVLGRGVDGIKVLCKLFRGILSN